MKGMTQLYKIICQGPVVGGGGEMMFAQWQTKTVPDSGGWGVPTMSRRLPNRLHNFLNACIFIATVIPVWVCLKVVRLERAKIWEEPLTVLNFSVASWF
jgi:hypothetical protein